jgi:hypothetical protein
MAVKTDVSRAVSVLIIRNLIIIRSLMMRTETALQTSVFTAI